MFYYIYILTMDKPDEGQFFLNHFKKKNELKYFIFNVVTLICTGDASIIENC